MASAPTKPDKKRTKRSELRASETVMLYPTVASVDDKTDGWRVRFEGTVYQPDRVSLQKRVLVRLLQRVMKVSSEEIATPLFEDRVRHFIVGTPRGRRILIQVGQQQVRLKKKSKRNGHFSGTVRLSAEEVEALSECDESVIHYTIDNERGTMLSTGSCHLIQPQGVSIISDIDDTLKHTMVCDRQEMLANTFLRPFVPIAGMASIYQQWQDQGCQFHYVSSSPWQLYGAIREFCEGSGFPDGSFHLRAFRLRDQMLKKIKLLRHKGKGAAIRMILRTFPKRKFVLVGDSGERDPEIYAKIARKYPRQVQSVLIRDLGEGPDTRQRIERLFEQTQVATTVFDDPQELCTVPLPPVFPLADQV